MANEAAETEARSPLIPKQILQWRQYDQKWQCLQQTAGLHFIFLTPTEQIKHFDTMWFKHRFLGEGESTKHYIYSAIIISSQYHGRMAFTVHSIKNPLCNH